MKALKHYTEINHMEEYREHYNFCTFAVVRPDNDGGYFEDIAYSMNDIPDDAVAFFILPECKY